jgi:Tfp pilus assembly protein PilP
MMSKRLVSMALAVLACGGLLVASAAAQTSSTTADPNAASPAPAPADPAASPSPTSSAIEDILQADEEVLEGSGYTYDPGGRRDPFKSLLAAQERTEQKGPRPAGIPGLLIDELTLTGIFKTGKGWVAQVQASNKDKSHLLRVGDQLFDGDVVSISANEVVFKQIVSDPTALKPFREVSKRLNP